jgi:pimeloyl-ACP methyl ester carboxylesterase
MPGKATTAKGLAGLGLLAAGVAVGAIAERLATRRLRQGEFVGVDEMAGQPMAIVTDDGVTLHAVVDDEAPPGAPTVIFTHGYALSSLSWPGQREALRGVARVVLWDHRGHGISQRGIGPTTIDRLGSDLSAVMDAVAPTGDVVLVGHSMGGMTIMALAEQRPEIFGPRVKAVALLATSAGGIAEVNLGLPRPFARLAHRIAPSIGAALESDGPVSALVERARRSSSDLGLIITRAYAFGATAPPDGTRFVANLIAGTPVEVLADLLPALQGHDKTRVLHVLENCDLLVMVGDADLLTPVGHSIEIVRHTPSAELVILPGVGHMLTLEAADDVNKHVRALVERVGDDAASN